MSKSRCVYCGEKKIAHKDSCTKTECRNQALREFSLNYPDDRVILHTDMPRGLGRNLASAGRRTIKIEHI